MCETVTISQTTSSSGSDSRCPSGGQQSPKRAPDTPAAIRRITESDLQARNEKLCEIVGKPEVLTSEQTEQLHQFLGEHHGAFSLYPNEQGETDLLITESETGEAAPKKQAVQWMPFVVRSEVAKQLRDMQAVGVVQPSSSP